MTVITAIATATPSSAAVGDWYYDNKSPSATGCNNDAFTVDTRYMPSGSNARIMLRYSPSCRTVWANVSGAATRTSDNAGGTARIHREQDNAALQCQAPVGGTSCFTNMLYDGGFTSHAHGWNDTGFTIHSATTSSY